MKHLICLISVLLSSYYAFAGLVVNNGLTHIYQVQSGNLIKGKIEIENSGEKPLDIKIYLQDLAYNASGTTYYTDPSGKDRSNAGWINLTTNIITINAKEKKNIDYTIQVPTHPLQQGSYWSAIMVEPTSALSPTPKSTSQLSIQSVVRYSIQIITNIQTDDLKPSIQFDSIQVKNQNNGIRTLHLAISNTGILYFRPTAIIELYNQNTSEKVGSFSSIPMGILPGNSKTFLIDLSKILPGKYSAVLMATDGADNAFAVNTLLEIKNE